VRERKEKGIVKFFIKGETNLHNKGETEAQHKKTESRTDWWMEERTKAELNLQ